MQQYPPVKVAKDTVFSIKKTLNFNGNLVSLSTPMVMGILNVTPDSFFDGGRYQNAQAIQSRCAQMLEEGADIIDIGGYSTRPGADNVGEQEETKRVTEAVKIVKKAFPEAVVSVDTFRAGVAHAAVQEGAAMVNDVSGGSLDQAMFETIARLKVPYVLMHTRGTPANMQQLTDYDDVFLEILDYFSKKVDILRTLGVKDIVIDPGFGFAKTLHQNYELLKKLNYFDILNLPILVGVSRKSMVYKLLGVTSAEALNGTSALHMFALMNGASILRVHDIKEANEVIQVYNAILD